MSFFVFFDRPRSVEPLILTHRGRLLFLDLLENGPCIFKRNENAGQDIALKERAWFKEYYYTVYLNKNTAKWIEKTKTFFRCWRILYILWVKNFSNKTVLYIWWSVDKSFTSKGNRKNKLQLFGFLSGFCLSSQKLQRTLPLKVKKKCYTFCTLNYRRFSLKNGLQKWKDLFGRVTCVKKL